jgi:hypothetical protein
MRVRANASAQARARTRFHPHRQVARRLHVIQQRQRARVGSGVAEASQRRLRCHSAWQLGPRSRGFAGLRKQRLRHRMRKTCLQQRGANAAVEAAHAALSVQVAERVTGAHAVAEVRTMAGKRGAKTKVKHRAPSALRRQHAPGSCVRRARRAMQRAAHRRGLRARAAMPPQNSHESASQKRVVANRRERGAHRYWKHTVVRTHISAPTLAAMATAPAAPPPAAVLSASPTTRDRRAPSLSPSFEEAAATADEARALGAEDSAAAAKEEE